jgi:chemotaxis protein histidine kinase CheA
VVVDQFTERLAIVRHRFISSLESKIEDTYQSLANMVGGKPDAIKATAESFRRIHGIVGVGPTVGFPSSGRAARSAENLLLPAYQAERGLNAEELLSFKKALHALREAVQAELQIVYSSWR